MRVKFVEMFERDVIALPGVAFCGAGFVTSSGGAFCCADCAHFYLCDDCGKVL